MTDDDIRRLYIQEAGRDPSPAEIADARRFSQNDFVGLSGSDIGALGMSDPRSRLNQLRQYGGMFERDLQGGDDRYLQMAQDRLQSDFMRQGRGLGGSAYVNAFANAARDLALQRQSRVSDFYQPGYQQVFNEIGQRGLQARQQGYRGLERARERDYEVRDYFQQQNDYNNYLGGQQKRNMQGALLQGGLGIIGSAVGGLAQGYGMGKGAASVKRGGF